MVYVFIDPDDYDPSDLFDDDYLSEEEIEEYQGTWLYHVEEDFRNHEAGKKWPEEI
jgi:hypothetical protein